jgi:hypothetical protein
VILDVVFNHTAEGDHTGPTLSFRGLCNGTYYILEQDRSRYANYSGTGNTLNANNAVVRRLILDSLRYWVEEMHVDGFRFDLASILGRGESGQLLPNPPVLWDIESDPALAGIKLIAEAWDAAGLYQVGTFIGDSWQEWNGRFRDDVRSFFRGEEGSVTRYADRILGSPEIYAHKAREAEQSVNFVTCHDGFTLNDLVSYDTKHNEANGENNRDGANDNRSWNCGFEGPTDDPAIEKLRNRQVKNYLTTTLLALGVPMIAMGDEARRTQRGNNNAYCQDNETSWFDWTLVTKHADVHRFVTLLAGRRLLRSAEPEKERESLSQLLREAKRAWHGVKLDRPDWSPSSHSLALTFEAESERSSSTRSGMPTGSRWTSICHRLTRSTDPSGADGSIRHWILPMISPNGHRRRRFPALRIGLRHTRSSCFSPTWDAERSGPEISNLFADTPSNDGFLEQLGGDWTEWELLVDLQRLMRSRTSILTTEHYRGRLFRRRSPSRIPLGSARSQITFPARQTDSRCGLGIGPVLQAPFCQIRQRPTIQNGLPECSNGGGAAAPDAPSTGPKKRRHLQGNRFPGQRESVLAKYFDRLWH